MWFYFVNKPIEILNELLSNNVAVYERERLKLENEKLVYHPIVDGSVHWIFSQRQLSQNVYFNVQYCTYRIRILETTIR